MMRIGEAARRFSISHRTLRYWEEMGILKSMRAENGYRHYDDENAARIQHIALLRGLRMPLADIERIFVAGDCGTAVDVLSKHLECLRRDAALHGLLIASVEALIGNMRQARSLAHVFACAEAKDMTAPPIHLSERVSIMSEERLNHVRIVRLPAMTVAAYRAESATPEDDCSRVFNRFVLEHSLHRHSGYRYFGFNNPSPDGGNPVYGYEMWVTVPDGFDVLQPLVQKQFGGGLYASISTRMNEIGERWKLLHDWCMENGAYAFDPSAQWLEECSMDFESFISEEVLDSAKQLDLLAPIQKGRIAQPER